jgi:hypothetical protein
MKWLWLCAALAAAGCGGDGGDGGGDGDAPAGDGGGDGDGAATDGPTGDGAISGVGAHALAYYRVESHGETLSTPPMTTRASGSTIVVSVGRGDATGFATPTDNQGNAPYAQLGTVHRYANWPGSGTAAYAATGVSGGAGHVVTTTTPYDDELTMAVVEVVDGGTVVDQQWNEVLAPGPLRSRTVTTTGPATLVAFWWGDAGAEGEKTASPGDGFTVTDAILEEGSLVQCAAAVKRVDAAGTYDVTWTATPVQGAQLWLIAIQ